MTEQVEPIEPDAEADKSDLAETETETETEPEPETETVPETETDLAAPVAARRGWATKVLVAVVVLLAVGAGALALGWRDARAADHAAQRRVAAQRADLAAAQQREADLAAKLKAAQDAALDPQGYELIKKCVGETADGEQAMKQAIVAAINGGATVYGAPPGGTLRFVPGTQPVDPNTIPTPCSDARKYLK